LRFVCVAVLVGILVLNSDASLAGNDPRPAHEKHRQRPDLCKFD
jgi:hypothetical protein